MNLGAKSFGQAFPQKLLKDYRLGEMILLHYPLYELEKPLLILRTQPFDFVIYNVTDRGSLLKPAFTEIQINT